MPVRAPFRTQLPRHFLIQTPRDRFADFATLVIMTQRVHVFVKVRRPLRPDAERVDLFTRQAVTDR